MYVIFINPQGNFDNRDSYLAQHPDFGGQLVYVKELAIAMARLGHQVDIVTRKINDDQWPEFAEDTASYDGYEGNPRIVRIACGGPKFLQKEHLWPHLDEFVDNLLVFYGNKLPDFVTSHYADGGYCAALLMQKAGLGFTFTGHSLGAQKLDKLGTTAENVVQMEQRYFFSKRVAAERLAMQNAANIITSTQQERMEQYSHPLYEGAVDVRDDDRFSVVPPGVNLDIFNIEPQKHDGQYVGKLRELTGNCSKPWVLAASRLDEKKNIIGIVNAYASDKVLQRQAGLAISVRGINDPFEEIDSLSQDEQKVLQPILDRIIDAGIRDKVIFLNIQSQAELAATYRYFAGCNSVFALTAYYEPFGLAPIEAAACGLVCVATTNGGPSEIFEDGSGVLVDPFDTIDIARGLNRGLNESGELSRKGYQRVISKYTWDKTAEGYIEVISRCKDTPGTMASETVVDAGEIIEHYLKTRPA